MLALVKIRLMSRNCFWSLLKTERRVIKGESGDQNLYFAGGKDAGVGF